MRIKGYRLREHLRLLAPLFGLIAAVWALRLVLFAAGVPLGVVRIVSVTIATAACILLAVLLIHGRGFGGYPNVVAAVFLLELCAQTLIVLATVFAALTGTQNVYTIPEFTGGLGHAAHISAQLTFALGIGTLFGSAMGCILLWLLRHLVPMKPRTSETPKA